MSVSKSQTKNYLNTQGCLATDYIAYSTSISELARRSRNCNASVQRCDITASRGILSSACLVFPTKTLTTC